jgi:hypothetical protein
MGISTPIGTPFLYRDVVLQAPTSFFNTAGIPGSTSGRKIFVGKIRFKDLIVKGKPKQELIEKRKSIFESLFHSYGAVEEFKPFWDKDHIFVVYTHVSDAERVISELSNYEKRKEKMNYYKLLSKNSPAVPSATFYVRWPRGINKSQVVS